MKRFSTNQLELLLEPPRMPQPTEFGTTGTAGPAELGTDTEYGEGSGTSSIEFPEFDGYSGTRAETARIAGRIVASQVSDAEYQTLLDERQMLLDKLLAKTISRREEIRLEYVRWSLDRIDDAKHGSDLDRIEDSISRYEHFLSELDQFKVALEIATKRRR